MARASKAENTLFGYLIFLGLLIGVPVYLFDKMNKTIGWELPTILLALGLALLWVVSAAKKRARLKYLRAKYIEADVQKILRKTIWVGQSTEQLTDSLGRPSAVDNKLLKTKRRDVWKYYHQGANRYALRITVENGLVAGWDSKA